MAGKSKRMASNPGQVLKTRSSPKRSEKEDRIAGNNHGSAILETGATSQTLPLYSDMQRRARFALCDERVNIYTLRMAL